MPVKRYPERLSDGRQLFEERFDLSLGTPEYTAEGVLAAGCTALACGLSEAAAVQEAKASGKIPEGALGVLSGIAGRADIINKNLRLYSTEAYTAATERAQTSIKAGNFYGEVDHPDYRGTLAGAAMRFTRLEMVGPDLHFDAVILDKAAGRELVGILKGGGKPQISTRGYASSTTEKRKVGGVELPIQIIGKDLHFEGIDPVLFASNPAGRVTHATTEATDSPSGAATHETQDMTLEKLRQEHPDLVAQIEAAARTGYVAQAEVETQVSTARQAGVEEGVRTNTEAAAPRLAVLDTVITAITALVPPRTEGEAATQIATLEAEVKTLGEKLTVAEAEQRRIADEKAAADALAEATRVEAARKAAVTEKVDALLAGATHADLLRDRLLAAESVEAAERLFAEQNDLILAVAARNGVTGKAAAEGTTDTGSADTAGSGEAKPKVETYLRDIAYGR